MKRFLEEGLMIAARSEKGNRKKVNQDSILVMIGEKEGIEFGIFAVADGMGGLAAGEFASSYTLEKIKKWWEEELPLLLIKEVSNDTIMDGLRKLIEKINKELIKESNLNCRMGTTLSLLFIYGDEYGLLHIGDSRIYIINNHLRQLTLDHSYVGDLVRRGRITVEEAKIHPKRNLLTQCLGVNEEIELYQDKGQFKKEDICCLCSDGFYNLLQEKEIIHCFMESKKDIKKGLDQLVSMVFERGAHDNLSAIVINQIKPTGPLNLWSIIKRVLNK